MLIRFFPHGKGGGAAPVNYLVSSEVLAYDENRDVIRDADGRPTTVLRDPLPEVLRGDAELTIGLIDSATHKWSYTSGVISFAAEDSPSEDHQRQVMNHFEDLAFAGLEADQYACLWVRHSHKGVSSCTSARPGWSSMAGRA